MAQRLGRIVGVEGHLVPRAAETLAAVEPFVVAPALALVLVHAGGVAVIEHLENTVMLDDPGDLLTDIGADNGGGHLAVVFRGKVIAEVVDQRGHDHLDVGAVLFGAGGRLQRMFQPVDLVAGKRAAQLFQRA